MKNISIIAVAACLAFSSCNDDAFLRETPEDFMTTDNSYLNVNQFKTGLNQMYSQVRALYNSNDGYHDWTMMGIGTDVLMIPRGNGKDQPFNDWGLVNTFNGVAGTWWNTNYSIIKNCNELLFQTENPQVNWTVEGQKEEVQAEIRFFRAFAYRNLGHIFGGVPLLDKPITEPTLNFVRSTRTETYKFALEDAKFAATYLPKEVTQDGRVVRATADHLLAELYIAYSDNGGENSYNKAIEAATRVIDGTDGDFRLMTERFGSRASEEGKDVYWDLFRIGNQNYLESGNKECLWAIQFEYNTSGGTNAFGRPLIERSLWPSFWQQKKFGYDGVARDWTGRGVAWVRPTNFSIYTMWKDSEGDIRNSEANIDRKFYAPKPIVDGEESDIDITYETPITLPDGTNTIIKLKPGDEIKKEYLTTRIDTMEYFFPRFFKFGTDKHLDGLPDNGYVPDLYVFRVADTYLLRAEAYLKAENKSAAQADINVVRNRAKANPVALDDVTIDYILDERARELFGEEYRYMTLSRMGKVYERTKKYGWEYSAETIKEHNNLMPIPQSAIDANLEAELKQNPGY